MCCAGPLFNVLMIDPRDALEALSVGLPLIDEGAGLAFWFPCPLLDGASCTVYDRRPGGCRAYRCETLKQLDRDEITLDEGLQRVEAALAAAECVETALEGETIPQFRRRLAIARDAGEARPESAANTPLAALDVLLNRDFRGPGQRIDSSGCTLSE
jgi:Fe-S-cluster containining protein